MPDSAAVSVHSLRSDREAAWDDYVRAHQNSTFFHLSAWQQVLRRAFGHRAHYLYAETAGRICGVLPLAEVRSILFGHSLVSTPFCVYGGIVADDDATTAALRERACELARELGVDQLELRNRRRMNPDWPVKELYVTFRKAIDPESESNMLAIPRKQRAMVRKGIQNGLRAEIDTDVRRCYDIYSESLRNLGTPVFSRRYMTILKEVFGDDCEVLTVVDKGEPIASVLNFLFRDEVLPYYGGSTAAARGVAGNDFMYWEVMERARLQGRRLFDYGRSKQGTGAFAFKKNWGFEPEPLYYEYYLVKSRQVPDVSPANPKFQQMIRLWRRLPLWLTQRVGPLVAKYLG